MWLLLIAMAHAQEPAGLREGDLVFHRSTSEQSDAIAAATGSSLTHMGVVLFRDGKPLVFEAIDPVRLTPLDDWVARGAEPPRIKRLQNADEILTPAVIAQMHALADAWVGTRYDTRFLWTDERLYCSELAWKLYERAAGVRLGEPRPLGSYDLADETVRTAAAKRFPEGLDPKQLVVAPRDVFDAVALVDAPPMPQSSRGAP